MLRKLFCTGFLFYTVISLTRSKNAFFGKDSGKALTMTYRKTHTASAAESCAECSLEAQCKSASFMKSTKDCHLSNESCSRSVNGEDSDVFTKSGMCFFYIWKNLSISKLRKQKSSW